MSQQRTMYKGLDLYNTDPNSAGRTRVTDVDAKWVPNQNDITHLPGALPVQTLTITDGAIAPSAAMVRVDTEGGAPADDLTAITPGDLHNGMEIELVSADPSRIVTIRTSSSASGIKTMLNEEGTNEDVELDPQWPIRLKLISTDSFTYWQEIPSARRTVRDFSSTPKENSVPVAGEGGKIDTGWVPVMTGATQDTPGAAGLVPTAMAGEQDAVLHADGTWKAVSGKHIGEIFLYSGTDIPPGSLRLDGQSIVGVTPAFPDFKKWAVDDGNAVLCTMDEYETELSTYEGQCGKFGWDAATDTLRLPTISKFVGGAMSVSEIGTAVQSGLPNATGAFYASIPSNGGNPSGAVVDSGLYNSTPGNGSSGRKFSIDLSRSSPIFGRSSNAVTPPHVKYPYCIHVYNSAIGASEAQAAEFVGLVDGLRQDVPGLAAHAAGPSKKYIDLTLPATGGTVTAPGEGWILFDKISDVSNRYTSLFNGPIALYSNGAIAGAGCCLLIPVKKNDVVTVAYNALGVTRYFRFIYANGSAPAEGE